MHNLRMLNSRRLPTMRIVDCQNHGEVKRGKFKVLSFCHRLSLNGLILSMCSSYKLLFISSYMFDVGHYFPVTMRIDVEIVNSSLLADIYSSTSIDLLLFVCLDTSTRISVAHRSKRSGMTT
jgi:hypothetical protein